MREVASPTEAISLPDYTHLESADWTFANSNTRQFTHGIHPYPAKFIPQCPRRLIEELHPKDGTAVLDPFCGSGTTLVEGAIAGIPAIGIDLSPIACLVSKVKVTPLGDSLEEAASRAAAWNGEVTARHGDIPRVDHWFRDEIQVELSRLLGGISHEDDAAIRDALQVGLASIIVRVSNQESDTRYAAVEKSHSPSEVTDLFLKASSNIARSLETTWLPMMPKPNVSVINKNVLAVEAEDIGRPVSLVVTSPPYPNAYEYWLYHKYRMYWLGMDPLAVKADEIGARPNYFRKNPDTADDFERQMNSVFSLLAGVVIDGGHVCFQVGNSVIHGEHVDNAALVERAALPNGFCLNASIKRTIPTTRKAFNPANSRIKDERILVFRKES